MPHFAERDEKTNAFQQQVCNLCHTTLIVCHCYHIVCHGLVTHIPCVSTLLLAYHLSFVCYVTSKLISVSLIVTIPYVNITMVYVTMTHRMLMSVGQLLSML